MAFQDEKWVDLLPKVERCLAKRGSRPIVPTLGYTKRVNCFVTLFWPRKNIAWNTFPRRRNREFRRHLSGVVAYAERRKLRRVILFVDHASSHGTPEVKKFLREHPVLRVKWLGKKDPNSNPVELLVNKRLSSAVCVNRCHADLPAATIATRRFLYKYNSIYAT